MFSLSCRLFGRDNRARVLSAPRMDTTRVPLRAEAVFTNDEMDSSDARSTFDRIWFRTNVHEAAGRGITFRDCVAKSS